MFFRRNQEREIPVEIPQESPIQHYLDAGLSREEMIDFLREIAHGAFVKMESGDARMNQEGVSGKFAKADEAITRAKNATESNDQDAAIAEAITAFREVGLPRAKLTPEFISTYLEHMSAKRLAAIPKADTEVLRRQLEKEIQQSAAEERREFSTETGKDTGDPLSVEKN